MVASGKNRERALDSPNEERINAHDFRAAARAKMKPFQSRVVAAWIVALPLGYAMNVGNRHMIARLSANPVAETAIRIHNAQRMSFVKYFITIFIFLALLAVIVEALANLIRKWFPDPPPASKTSA